MSIVKSLNTVLANYTRGGGGGGGVECTVFKWMYCFCNAALGLLARTKLAQDCRTLQNKFQIIQ